MEQTTKEKKRVFRIVGATAAALIGVIVIAVIVALVVHNGANGMLTVGKWPFCICATG